MSFSVPEWPPNYSNYSPTQLFPRSSPWPRFGISDIGSLYTVDIGSMHAYSKGGKKSHSATICEISRWIPNPKDRSMYMTILGPALNTYSTNQMSDMVMMFFMPEKLKSLLSAFDVTKDSIEALPSVSSEHHTWQAFVGIYYQTSGNMPSSLNITGITMPMQVLGNLSTFQFRFMALPYDETSTMKKLHNATMVLGRMSPCTYYSDKSGLTYNEVKNVADAIVDSDSSDLGKLVDLSLYSHLLGADWNALSPACKAAIIRQWEQSRMRSCVPRSILGLGNDCLGPNSDSCCISDCCDGVLEDEIYPETEDVL